MNGKMMRLILNINAGSSSVKFALMAAEANKIVKDYARGQIEGLGREAEFSMRFTDGRRDVRETMPAGTKTSHKEALGLILKTVDDIYGLSSLVGAGHRVVHGGPHFIEPVRLDEAVTAELKKLIPLAPLHQPHNLAAVDSLR